MKYEAPGLEITMFGAETLLDTSGIEGGTTCKVVTDEQPL